MRPDVLDIAPYRERAIHLRPVSPRRELESITLSTATKGFCSIAAIHSAARDTVISGDLLFCSMANCRRRSKGGFRLSDHRHTMVHEQMAASSKASAATASDAVMVLGWSTVAFYHDSTNIATDGGMVASTRMIAKIPTLAAWL